MWRVKLWRGCVGCEKSNLFFHSERREEFSLRFKSRKREIPRRAARLGMTKILVFPQAGQHMGFGSCSGETPQARSLCYQKHHRLKLTMTGKIISLLEFSRRCGM